MRTVGDMGNFYESIRRTRFQRGPRRMLAGIAGGVAVKLGLNVWVTRLLILLSFLLPVLGLGAYLVVWILTPWQNGSIPLERMFGGGRDLRR